ncbi:hypothetical protein M0P48_04695 [Candidatus Gracilibacteria bacterium]|jgi:hypothetical protein|nr:hypothetical protein [Candidatus Gracilibacteria bacterium]
MGGLDSGVDRDSENFEFSKDDIGTFVYVDGVEAFKVTGLSKDFKGGFELEVVDEKYKKLPVVQDGKIEMIKLIAKDGKHNQFSPVWRISTGEVFVVEIVGFEPDGKKKLKASILPYDFPIANL